MHTEAKILVEKLALQPHPEGGFYKEVYRAKDEVLPLSRDDSEKRNASTSIYYLLTSNDYSAWHRIKSDEIWHFYQGCPLSIYILSKNKKLQIHKLGNPAHTPTATFQVIVEANQWFAAQPDEPNNYTLAGCTVAPGFDFKDFELADHQLIQSYPEQAEMIRRFRR